MGGSVDLNVLIPALLVAVPATIAAIAAVKGNKQGRALHTELASPNGTTTAVAIQDIKSSVATIANNQAIHDLADQERFRLVHQRIDSIDENAVTVRHDLVADASKVREERLADARAVASDLATAAQAPTKD